MLPYEAWKKSSVFDTITFENNKVLIVRRYEIEEYLNGILIRTLSKYDTFKRYSDNIPLINLSDDVELPLFDALKVSLIKNEEDEEDYKRTHTVFY